MASNYSSNNHGRRKRLGGIRVLRTAAKTRLRSKPKSEGQEHLEMYVLARERARWSRTAERAAEAVQEIEREMKKLRKTSSAFEDMHHEECDSQLSPELREKNFGTFAVEY